MWPRGALDVLASIPLTHRDQGLAPRGIGFVCLRDACAPRTAHKRPLSRLKASRHFGTTGVRFRIGGSSAPNRGASRLHVSIGCR
jgi:hypothetical protein